MAHGAYGTDPVDAPDLDHLALAAEHAWDNLDRYAGDLGGRFVGGGLDPGFHWSQVAFADGMKVELLEPADTEEFDFLRRFLDHSGPGPHHLTVKVPDVEATIAAAEAVGQHVVGVNLDSDDWKEAFLHPKAGPGIVIQLAQPAPDAEPSVPVEGMTPSRLGSPAHLERVVLLVADLDRTVSLFTDVLGAHRSGDGDHGGPSVDLAWPGPGRLRVVQPTDDELAAWMGDRTGRVHHVELHLPEPSRIRDARPLGDGTWELAPGDNLGTRLRLREVGG